MASTPVRANETMAESFIKVKHEDTIYEIPTYTNNKLIHLSNLSEIASDIKGLSLDTVDGTRRILKRRGDFIYLPAEEELRRQIFLPIVPSLPTVHFSPGASSTRMQNNNSSSSVSNPGVALQETFSGKGWKLFHQHFLNVSRVNDWDSDTKGRQLAASLRGNALEVQSNLDIDRQRNYDALVTALSSRFETMPSSAARKEFHCAKRKKDENVVDYANRLRTLLADAHPSLPSTHARDLLLQQFIDGMDSVAVRQPGMWKRKR